jgi:nucleoside-diphosphate-sugar epimerase
MSKVLITGGAGFIGSNLAEALLKQGHQVRVLDNFSTGKRENLVFDKTYPSLTVVEGDIRDRGICQTAMEDVEFVFHQAAQASVLRSVEDPLTSNSINVEGTLNLLLAARNVGAQRFIYASSCAVYGDDPVIPKKEDMPPSPLSPYALQKYVGEGYCQLFFQLYGLETISLRYFNIFGPKQDSTSVYSAVIPMFSHALFEGLPPIVFGDGEQSRDFTYIDNVVQANLLAMSVARLTGERINVACGERVSLNQLLKFLKTMIGSNVSQIYQESRKGDVRHSQADITKGKEVLGYDPIVAIEEGLKKTVAYFQRLRAHLSIDGGGAGSGRGSSHV